MNERDKIFKKFCKEKNDTAKQKLFHDYKNLRNKVVFEIKNAKTSYFTKYFVENNNNISNIWKGIKSLITIKSKLGSAPITLKKDNSEITNPTEVAEMFNKCFVNVGPQLANKISKAQGHFSKFINIQLSNSLYLSPTDEKEISKILSSLNPNKTLGPSSIPVHILKNNIHILAKPISVLVNQSFEQGEFPECLKIAQVTPIHKKGDTTICSNYRPISVLSIFSKIFEKCMYTRIYSFLNKYMLIYKRQFGFRAAHSTNHALASLVEYIKEKIDNDNYVCGVFIDLQKAFDTVDHDILIRKLEYYGIRGKANDWLKSFLYERKQFVSINGFKSSNKVIKCGVPQGSTLGPLLFLIYINDLSSAFSESVITHHFADDTNLLYANTNIRTIETILNFELKQLVEWLKANKLSLNASKTDLLCFINQKNHPLHTQLNLIK